MKRRNFLKCIPTSLGSCSIASSFLSSASAQAADSGTDYKALIVVSLEGANDVLNTFIPTNTQQTENGYNYNNYSLGRYALRVNNNPLILPSDEELRAGLSANPYSGDDSDDMYRKGLYPLTNVEYGVNGLMPELARLHEDGALATINGIGTLIKPSIKSELESGIDVPPQLFSHNHQRKVIQLGHPGVQNYNGWAHRMAAINSGQRNVSFAGTPDIFQGGEAYLSGSPGAPKTINKLASEPLFATINGMSTENLINRYMNKQFLNSKRKMDSLAENWNSMKFSAKDPYGNALFAVPSTTDTELDDGLSGQLIESFETVAKFINESLNGVFYDGSGKPSTQIFYINFGGFDTHSQQTKKHATLLRELSLALWKFWLAVPELGLDSSQVTVMTQSDFGRTLLENRTGTDHAWGSHQMVMGGAVEGGKMFGESPSLILGGESDITEQGRFIPTTSYEQLFASCCNWLGTDSELLKTLFPTLENFENPLNQPETMLIDGLFKTVS